ncbi:MAG TPA: hypothetical protein VGM68_08750 [Rhizomicrobium sp.]
MMILRNLAAAAALVMLGGCWQADGSLYAKADPVTPFRAGQVTQTGGKDGDKHFALTLNKDGSYRLTGTGKDAEPGEAIGLRILNLRGIPEDMYLYEAVSLSHCNTPSGCDAVKANDPRYYGLIRKTATGAEEIRPDCKRDHNATEPFGIKEKGGVCTFKARDGIETGMIILAQTGRKPDYIWRMK